MFGHPGGEVVDFIEALAQHQIEFILTGHESAAAFMAGAVGRLTGFPGACRIHRAEIMRLRGDWPAAEQQAVAACEELGDFERHITAAGYSEIAEIRRRRGDFAGAEEATKIAAGFGA